MQLKKHQLTTVLPISQIPSLPACMYQAGRILPLEHIFRVPAPAASDDNDQYAAKKTWREARETIVEETKAVWTAGSVMEGRALDRGYCELRRSVLVLASAGTSEHAAPTSLRVDRLWQ